MNLTVTLIKLKKKDDASRCKIQEITSDEEGAQFYEMNILDLS